VRLSDLRSGRPLPPESFLVLISVDIGNQTRDLPAYSIVPQPTTLQRPPIPTKYSWKIFFQCESIVWPRKPGNVKLCLVCGEMGHTRKPTGFVILHCLCYIKHVTAEFVHVSRCLGRTFPISVSGGVYCEQHGLLGCNRLHLQDQRVSHARNEQRHVVVWASSIGFLLGLPFYPEDGGDMPLSGLHGALQSRTPYSSTDMLVLVLLKMYTPSYHQNCHHHHKASSKPSEI
jgi:hypothetical protein